MPKHIKRDSNKESQNKRNNDKCGFISNRHGISTVDIIIIVVSSLVIIILGIFLYTNFQTLRQLNTDIEEIKIIIGEKQATLNKLIELGQSEEVLKENYEKNLLYLPKIKNEVGIIADVTGIVEKENGKFRTITYGEEMEKESGVIDVPFTIRVDSTYEQLNEIVSGFSSTNRLYVIDSVTIIETSGNKEILSTDIKMHAYYKN